MAEIVWDYRPNSATTTAYHRSAAKFRLLLGGAGAGKTTAMCAEDIAQAIENPGSTGVVFRRHYPSLRDSTQRQWLSLLPRELAQAGKYVKTEGREAFLFPPVTVADGRTLQSRTLFRCLDDFLKLGSMEFDRVSLDEAREIAEVEFREVAFRRLRGQVGPRRLTCCTNPPDEQHWLHRFFVEDVEQDETLRDERVVFHCSTYDNAAHLPPGVIAGLERGSAQEKRQYLYGLWGIVADGPAVYPEFVEPLHVADLVPIKGHEVIRGWDFGYWAPVCVFVQVDAHGHVAVLHEVVGREEQLPAFAARVVQETERYFPDCPVRDYCDIAGAQKNDRGPTAVKILKSQFGITPRYRKQGINEGLERIRTLLTKLGTGGVPLLRVNRRCKVGIKTLGGALYYKPKDGELCDTHPYRDWFDAFRYLGRALLAAPEPMATTATLPSRWRQAV